MDKQFAYSVLEIKAMDEDGDDKPRRFSGIATTPTPDRVGDIVEPKGAQFKLPVPLLWQHNSGQPIGWVRSAKVNADGIEVECEIHNESKPGKLKDRLDEAWQCMRAKLVQGLSIGFKPIESARINETYSYRFMKWQWLELSAVTVPANSEAFVTAMKGLDPASEEGRRALLAQIKSADMAIRSAAPGAGRIVRLDPAPAASGIQQPGASGRRKGVVYLN